MYSLEYLPSALKDMAEIAHYIGIELSNPIAADDLANLLVDACGKLKDFPYSHPVYVPIKPLEHEYRRMLVQNYFVFYWVDEGCRLITIARVIYAKREKFL